MGKTLCQCLVGMLSGEEYITIGHVKVLTSKAFPHNKAEHIEMKSGLWNPSGFSRWDA